ncbi:MAG: hypothetical protein ACP5U0_07470 [Caldisphaera sp.]
MKTKKNKKEPKIVKNKNKKETELTINFGIELTPDQIMEFAFVVMSWAVLKRLYE